MNLLERIKLVFSRSDLAPSIDQQWWQEFGYIPGALSVHEKSVLGLAPVQKIIKKITNTITSLPITVYRTPIATGIPQEVDNITSRILTHGNRAYLKAFIRDYILRGRGLLYMERAADSTLQALHNLPISQVVIDRVLTQGGFSALTYQYSPSQSIRNPTVFTEPQIVDIVNLPTDQGLCWSDPLIDNKKIFEYALQVEAYAEYFFNQKGVQHVLTSPDANSERSASFIKTVAEVQKRAQDRNMQILPPTKVSAGLIHS